jgi:hypothetical protein
MAVDCDTCAVRGPACAGCLVSAVIGAGPGATPGRAHLDDAEHRAVLALADAGLLPELRYLPVDAPLDLLPADLVAEDPDESCGYLPTPPPRPIPLPQRRPRRRAA